MTVREDRTQVAIVGAGPAGLLLSHLLHREGIESVILENRDRAYVEGRIRAGVLEHGTVDVLTELGLADRLHREGLPHEGIELRFGGGGHRIDLSGLTGGKTITVYGQHEVVKDLIQARLDQGLPLEFSVSDVALNDVETEAPSVTYTDADGTERRLQCDYIAGCDGFHGVSRAAIPAEKLSIFERVYPFAWLGILAEAPPPQEELIYTNHPNGFSLASMRSPTISRLYLQVPPDAPLEDWPDDRVWEELHRRNAVTDGARPINEGPIVQKGVTAMRSFITEPMRYGRLFLAGDAAHIVPPTGAKGMNLAVADVVVLSRALAAHAKTADESLLDRYSATCLDRIWKVSRFSWWMTQLLHRYDDDDAFGHRLQVAELDYVVSSEAASRTLAENYVGLPLPV